MHLNRVRKGRVAKPEQWRWSSYNNLALDKEIEAGCPIQIDYARPPESYRRKAHDTKSVSWLPARGNNMKRTPIR